jgi:hypothetical protein
MTESAAKHRLIIKTTGPRLLYPIINAFCSDSGLSFNDAKSKLTTTGAMLEFTSKEQADNAAAKYRKLGCSIIEESTDAASEEIGDERVWNCAGCGKGNKLSVEKCDCGYELYQSSNEDSGASMNKNTSDDKEISGFAGIGKRIDNLKDDISSEDTAAWKQETETPQKTKPEGAKQQSTPKPKVYVPSSKQKTPSFRLSFSKVFWGIIIVVIIASMFSQNNDKKKTTYTPSGGTSTPPYSSPASNDDDTVSVGQYRCSRSHHNSAQELKPSDYEKQSIESEQSVLASLKIEIETAYVDRYSQSSIDHYNMLVNDYNSREQNHQRNIDRYNNKVATYNNYLMSNCRKAY